MKTCFLVLDCGATNVRAIALDPQGNIIAREAVANRSEAAQENPAWHQWSLEAILQRFAECCRRLRESLNGYDIAGLTVTTFGVDGALVDDRGELLYPVISWKCPRTAARMAEIDPQWLQQISGVGHFSFNTLYRLLWLQEHHPQALSRARAWLFISSLINHRLTGTLTTDRTMAGTSQLLALPDGQLSTEILTRYGLRESLFPPQIQAGERVGTLLPEAARLLGLPAGLPVIASGHDTQFALFGAGADVNQPVLSSGTWEILMVRSASVNTQTLSLTPGSTCELDSAPGLFNPGMQYLASGVLEWVRELLWTAQTPWQTIIAEAQEIPSGCEGVTMNGQLLTSVSAGWQGVTLNTTRAHLYRAALEGLTAQLKHNLALLEGAAGFTTRELLLVGGGSRNALWNQMKANALGLPLKILDDAETTVLGAACYGWAGVGYYPDADSARRAVNYRYRTILPEEN